MHRAVTEVAVRLAPLLLGYTGGQGLVRGRGATVDAVLHDLDRQFPGIRFRIVDEQGRVRRHMRVFLNQDDVRDPASAVAAGDELFVVGALSGG